MPCFRSRPSRYVSCRSTALAAIAPALGLFLSSATAHAQTVTIPAGSGNTPITVTGWNENVINSATNLTGAVGLDFPNQYGYYANGYQGDYNGLPSDGASLMDGNSYQFQSYNSNNALYLTANTTYQSSLPGVAATGTLALSTPTSYSTLSFLSTSTNGGGSGTVTLNFSDGTTSNYAYTTPDWYKTGTGQFGLSAALYRTSTNGAINTTGGNFGITESRVTLSSTDAAKTISSMTFSAPVTDPTKATTTAIFAVSGSTGTYTPSVINSLSVASGAFTAQSGFIVNGLNQTTTSTSAYIKQTNATTSVLRLTDNTSSEASSAFSANKVNISSAFKTSFSFTQSGTADGMTLILQGNSPYAVGAAGGSLGYAGTSFSNSIGVAMDFYQSSKVALVTDGTIGTYTTLSSASSLGTGSLITGEMDYDGSNYLSLTLTNSSGTQLFTQSYAVGNISSYVGGNSAYLGFTGGTGGLTSTQDIYSLIFAPVLSASMPEPGMLALLPIGLLGIVGAARRPQHTK